MYSYHLPIKYQGINLYGSEIYNKKTVIQERPYYIYLYLRKDDGIPCYVGRGKNNRAINIIEHYRHNTYLMRTVTKHGVIIFYPYKNLTYQESLKLEIEIIAEIRVSEYKDKLCNMTDGGEGCTGYKATEETKKRMSISQIGKVVSEETKSKISVARKNISERIREKLRSRKPSNETKEKISVSCKGRIHSEETREKLRIINTGRVVSEETREKLKSAWVTRKVSEETKAKISASLKGKKLSEEARVKRANTRAQNKILKILE